jgi:hypothetical protein
LAGRHHRVDLCQFGGRRFLDPCVAAGAHRVCGDGGKAGPAPVVVVGHREDAIQILFGEHLAVVAIGTPRAELAGVRCGTLLDDIGDSDEIDRCVPKRGIDVAVGVAAAADESGPNRSLRLESILDHALGLLGLPSTHRCGVQRGIALAPNWQDLGRLRGALRLDPVGGLWIVVFWGCGAYANAAGSQRRRAS